MCSRITQVWTINHEQHVLLASLPHSITDGASVGLLQQELSAAYDAVLQGNAPAWEPLLVQVCTLAETTALT